MNEHQMFVRAMLDKALNDWNNGTEPELFPVTPKDSETSGTMLLSMGLNAMAYGLEHGIELGYKMKSAELE